MPCKKTYFSNEKIALEYAARLQATSKRKVVPHRAYLCEKCLTWHLTSLSESKEKTLSYQIESLEKAIANKNKEIAKKDRRIEDLSDAVVRLNKQLRIYEKNSFEELKKRNNAGTKKT